MRHTRAQYGAAAAVAIWQTAHVPEPHAHWPSELLRVQELRERAGEGAHWRRQLQALQHQCDMAASQATAALGARASADASAKDCSGSGGGDVARVVDQLVLKLKGGWPQSGQGGGVVQQALESVVTAWLDNI